MSKDKIIIATQEIFSAIAQNEEMLNQLGRIEKEKELKEIFKANHEAFSEISGICLLIADEETASARSFPRFHAIKIPAKIILIATLAVTLAASYFIFNGDRTEKKDPSQEKLEEARAKILMGENFIILKKDEKAQAYFQEAWDILKEIQESGFSGKKEAASLQKSVEEYLDKK